MNWRPYAQKTVSRTASKPQVRVYLNQSDNLDNPSHRYHTEIQQATGVSWSSVKAYRSETRFFIGNRRSSSGDQTSEVRGIQMRSRSTSPV